MSKRSFSLAGVALVGALALFYPLMAALVGFPPYRDQHLGTALIYLEEGVSLLNTRIIGFNANQVPTILEFPWWQAGAAGGMRLTGGAWVGANLFSLGIFALGIVPMYRMGKRLLGRDGAWWAVVAFLAQPVVFEFAGTASPDGMSLVAALWAYDRIRAFALKGGLGRGLAAMVLGATAATLKMPFFMTAGLAAALEVLAGSKREVSAWIRLGMVAGFAGIIFLSWTRYTDGWLQKALWPLVDLRVSHNPEMMSWYFGDWGYRLSPGVWLKGGWRVTNSLFGSFALAGVALLGWCRPENQGGRAWLAGGLITTAVFFHLVLHHSHYYLMFAPAAALGVAGGGVFLVERAFPGASAGRKLAGLVSLGLLMGALMQGLLGREIILQFDPYPRRIAQQVCEKTSPTDRLLIAGGGWGGDILFRSERKGLSIWNTRFLEEPANLQKARDLGFTRLVVVRESPLLTALQKTNPGNASYVAEPFAHYLSPVAEGFPVFYQDEQLMIREIP